MRAIIVDDEIHSARLLVSFCKRYAPFIEVVATSDHAEEATELIIKHKPDLVFLDVELYDKTAFDVLKNIDAPDMMVVMVTAHEKYVMQAIKVRVMDYLLKPVDIDEFVVAVNKCKKELARIEQLRQIPPGEDTMASEPQEKYYIFPAKEKPELLTHENILHLEAQGYCTRITTMEEQIILSTRPLKEYEDKLTDKNFCKVHRSHIVNLNGIKNISKTKTATLTLIDGTVIPLSDARRKEVLGKVSSDH